MSGRRPLIKGYFAALRLIENQTASVGCAGGPVKGEVPGETVLRQPIDCVGVPQLIVRKSADNRERGSLARAILQPPSETSSCGRSWCCEDGVSSPAARHGLTRAISSG
jgi:hypothetical protein